MARGPTNTSGNSTTMLRPQQAVPCSAIHRISVRCTPSPGDDSRRPGGVLTSGEASPTMEGSRVVTRPDRVSCAPKARDGPQPEGLGTSEAFPMNSLSKPCVIYGSAHFSPVPLVQHRLLFPFLAYRKIGGWAGRPGRVEPRLNTYLTGIPLPRSAPTSWGWSTKSCRETS